MLPRLERAIADDRGNALPLASAIITHVVDSQVAILYSDRAASTVLSLVGVASADFNGVLDCYIQPGVYTVALTSYDGVYTASYDIQIDELREVIDDSSTARTLSHGDSGNYIKFSNASAIQIDVPHDDDVYFNTAQQIHFRQGGAGAYTFNAATGVTINAPREGTLVSAGQGATNTLKKVAANEWDLIGDTVAA